MTTTTDQTTATTSAPSPDASIEELQADLADAEAELQGLPAATAAARTGGEPAEWMRLLTRAEELPVGIEAARERLLAAELAQAWVTVERCDATEQRAVANLTAASTARDEFDRSRFPRNMTAEQVAAELQVAARLWDQLANSKVALAVARHATEMALVQVEMIEDAVEAATGERPPPGEGLRAPVGRLRVTFVAHHPASYDPLISGSPSLQGATTLTFLAGTVPPRWAAREMTAPGVWEAAE